MKSAFIFLIKMYQKLVSPCLGACHCRFFPSCSQYMLDAIQTYGIVRGLIWGTKRLLRCHPFCAGGVDPLPLPHQKILEK
jgi:putative membrane protein insertion efficiency factor